MHEHYRGHRTERYMHYVPRERYMAWRGARRTEPGGADRGPQSARYRRPFRRITGKKFTSRTAERRTTIAAEIESARRRRLAVLVTTSNKSSYSAGDLIR